MCLIEVTRRVALLWTGSIRSWSAQWNGSHATLPYPKCGRTSVVYISGRVDLSISSSDRLMIPRIWLAFAAAEAACLRNLNEESTKTPSLCSASTASRHCLRMAYLTRGLLRHRCGILHFPSLNGSCQRSDHATRASMSPRRDVVAVGSRASCMGDCWAE